MVSQILHGGLANTVGLYFLAVAIWGYILFFRKQAASAAFMGAVMIAEILVIVQGLIGGYLWIIGLRPARTIHLLYGIVLPLILPGVYLYTKGEDGRPEVLMYATAALFAAGLTIRAITTGRFGF